ncbi:AlbA family DNA-binding domain-containing protein [Bradyrhizobium sp. CCBAU 21362]|uniref:AlbA family DNA-binding domain-containing protein n=1 Tax=Bradyrhizobium sp. CCBAU 21362 TaxID=1325082 RepID=UPI002305F527|nr:ATP-binding protein [Bradyrhizobium sp. CCBAU 21362]
MPDELSELIDSPVERLHVEYKSWLDLAQPKTRADLARHIAAISNFGGGKIVFGIADDGQSCGPAPAGFELTHDTVVSITKRYLDPAVHCDVRWIQSKLGVDHPIVIVPSHGATPICAKANGPELKGKIEGIVAGAYYLRKPGPESAPIVTAADWRDIIRRCALHDRSTILAALSAALSTENADTSSANPRHLLEQWAASANADYLRRAGEGEYAAPIRDCRIQLSYVVETESPEEQPSSQFLNILREVAGEVDQHVASGWSLFYVFGAEPFAPRWDMDSSAPAEEFMQSSLIDATRTIGFDLWRISQTGLATAIREFWEDTPDFGFSPRVALNPRMMTRMLRELVWHAAIFAGRFAGPVRVHFRCEWRGLKGRRLVVPNAIPFRTRPAEVDTVVTETTWAAGALRTDIAEVVYRLGGKLARALDWDGLSAAGIAAEMPRWKQL